MHCKHQIIPLKNNFDFPELHFAQSCKQKMPKFETNSFQKLFVSKRHFPRKIKGKMNPKLLLISF